MAIESGADVFGAGHAAVGGADTGGNAAPVLDDAGTLSWPVLERVGDRRVPGGIASHDAKIP